VTREQTHSTDDPAFAEWLETTDDRFADAERRRVQVFVRSLLPPLGTKGTQEALIRRLDDLTAAEILDDVSVTVTGNRLCLCETCTGTDAGTNLLDSFNELNEWGGEFDASVAPFFETRELDASLTNETARALVPPRIAVALYCDESLAGVFPCEMGDSTLATADLVAALDRFCEGQEVVAGP